MKIDLIDTIVLVFVVVSCGVLKELNEETLTTLRTPFIPFQPRVELCWRPPNVIINISALHHMSSCLAYLGCKRVLFRRLRGRFGLTERFAV